MPRPWPAACHANALASSMPCHGLVQQLGTAWPWSRTSHATALASSPCPSGNCHYVSLLTYVQVALRNACPSGNSHLVGFDLRTCLPVLSQWKLVAKSMSVPRKLPVAFVICIRANRCLLGFSKCFCTFVGLLSPSGCDSHFLIIYLLIKIKIK